jgi:hypothetical protein
MISEGNAAFAPTARNAGATPSATRLLSSATFVGLAGLAGLALGARDRRFMVLTAAAAMFALGRAGLQIRRQTALEPDDAASLPNSGLCPDEAAATDMALAERYDRYAG